MSLYPSLDQDDLQRANQELAKKTEELKIPIPAPRRPRLPQQAQDEPNPVQGAQEGQSQSEQGLEPPKNPETNNCNGNGEDIPGTGTPETSTSKAEAETTPPATSNTQTAYPRLHEYMGLELTQGIIRQNMPEYLLEPSVPSDEARGVKREVTMSKTETGSPKFGLRIRAMKCGVFVTRIYEGSAAAVAGRHFGDQIIEINGFEVAKLSSEKVHKILKKSGQEVHLVVKDRPFEHQVSFARESGRKGFQLKHGRISSIVKDSSAAQSGLLAEHTILEVNGVPVAGLKDKDIASVLNDVEGDSLHLKTMPAQLYTQLVKDLTSIFSMAAALDTSSHEY